MKQIPFIKRRETYFYLWLLQLTFKHYLVTLKINKRIWSLQWYENKSVTCLNFNC